MRLLGHVHRHSGPEAFRGRASRTYDFMARRLLRRAYRRLADDLVGAIPDGGAVLDVGTGPGVLLAEIAQRRPDVRLTGVDPSPDMVTAAERNLGRLGDRATVRVGSAAELPLPDASFDLIVSSFSLHHWEDPAAAVPELARVLRPGGRLYHLRLPVRAVRGPHCRGRRPFAVHRRGAQPHSRPYRHTAFSQVRPVRDVRRALIRRWAP